MPYVPYGCGMMFVPDLFASPPPPLPDDHFRSLCHKVCNGPSIALPEVSTLPLLLPIKNDVSPDYGLRGEPDMLIKERKLAWEFQDSQEKKGLEFLRTNLIPERKDEFDAMHYASEEHHLPLPEITPIMQPPESPPLYEPILLEKPFDLSQAYKRICATPQAEEIDLGKRLLENAEYSPLKTSSKKTSLLEELEDQRKELDHLVDQFKESSRRLQKIVMETTEPIDLTPVYGQMNKRIRPIGTILDGGDIHLSSVEGRGFEYDVHLTIRNKKYPEGLHFNLETE